VDHVNALLQLHHCPAYPADDVLRGLCHHLLTLQPASMSLMVDLSTSNFLTLLAIIPQKSPSFTTNEQIPPKRSTP
jgi:hypothetical protein